MSETNPKNCGGNHENSASQWNNGKNGWAYGGRECLDGNGTIEWLDVNGFCAECFLGAINSGYTSADCLVRSAEGGSLTSTLTW
jgi:hypothetical protein